MFPEGFLVLILHYHIWSSILMDAPHLQGGLWDLEKCKVGIVTTKQIC